MYHFSTMAKRISTRSYARRSRRRFTRRTTSRRLVRGRTTLRRLSRRVSRVTRNFQPEFKRVDMDLQVLDGEPIGATGIWAVTAASNLGTPGIMGSAPPIPGYMAVKLPAITQGSTVLQRVGNQVLYRSIQITGLIAPLATEVGGAGFSTAMTDMSGYVKIIVLLDKQAREGVDTDPMTYFMATDVRGHYSIASRRQSYRNLRYQVLASRTYALSMGNKPSAMVNIQIPMRRVMHYSGAQGEYESNQHFHVIAVASPTLNTGATTPTSPIFALSLQARVRFVDC